MRVTERETTKGSSNAHVRWLHAGLLVCGLSCTDDAAAEGDASSATQGTGDSDGASATDSRGSADGSTGASGASNTATDGNTDTDSNGDSNSDTNGDTEGSDYPWIPGIAGTVQDELPGAEPLACEWDWTIRLLAPFPNYGAGHAPRRMYFASCDADTPSPRLLSSYTVGPKNTEGPIDETSGGLTISALNPETNALEVESTHHFPECKSMHGVAAAGDCSTVAALCRIENTATGWDHDAIAEHPNADWLTNENECGNTNKMNDHMWLYEWPDGDLSKEPTKVIVHKSIGSWEYGQNTLRYGEDDGTYGIALKTTTGPTGNCHEADSFMILDRSDFSFITDRGWDWACATGHTTHNRSAYNPATQMYAMLCSTDWNDDGVPGQSAISFRMENASSDTEFHYSPLYSNIWIKGGAGPLLPRPDGGFLGLIVGEPAPIVAGYDDTIPVEVGLVRFDASGNQEGDIVWVASHDDSYYAWPQIAPLGDDRYLLGWGAGLRVSDIGRGDRDRSLRIPWTYWLMEIDGQGNPLTEPSEMSDVGWGEVNEMVPLGTGRVAWSYAPDAVLAPETAEVPDCNQDSLVHYVYTSETPPP